MLKKEKSKTLKSTRTKTSKGKTKSTAVKQDSKLNELQTDRERKTVIMQGNEAVAYGALDAGVNFFAGYPITPSTEIAEILAAELPKRGGTFIQMEDEIASICAITGASLAGAKSLTATSGPGFSLMQEGIGFAKITETPCVVVNVQRMGPSTGMPTSPAQGDIMQSRWGSHGDSPAIVLYPDSVKESYELTIRSVNLSEKYRTCVILLLDEVLGHMRESVRLPDIANARVINRIKPTVPPHWYKHYDENQKYLSPLASYGDGYRFHVTGLTHDAHGFPTNKSTEAGEMMERLRKKISYNIRDLVQIESHEMDDARIAIFAAGITARAAKAAIAMARHEGIKVGLLRPLTIWPFPDDAVRKMLRDVETVIVPELNQGQLIHEIRRLTKDKSDSDVLTIQRVNGQLITPNDILRKIKEVS
ncbi:MAG: 2-oxoacid:acceptor oxidoreductase subunit alpha [Candidatus Cloacimonetes bacterium]|jgi:2-oxoglutarate ferredoxin oxidoreductase subunit alpha|nr:2-oxoacid:acceptor oxidoreductase subunit alpha [Candidatus Cloacimonadota bacterium]MDY0299426.1 2-oxoacid:acceptor oxidoreductase subunit alpha [Candidatus Cloacimonadaceae bacterium]MCB5278880.1 2-oxoacid:acceptor oxidoreductase subunit alpha [Candidatus Cloacimonadota bacterium]MCK9332517.1 2-oxoacid:acceptor oxidoreductase subunit alpha [Candidatus Cloacimonadota bacterium]MDD2210936.1 2-oxoacid:acceptor oxidoreductase subunit alpha [Candidatus Cloacimonadota bacterium]